MVKNVESKVNRIEKRTGKIDELIKRFEEGPPNCNNKKEYNRNKNVIEKKLTVAHIMNARYKDQNAWAVISELEDKKKEK